MYESVTNEFTDRTNPISKPNSAWICCIQLKLWSFCDILPILAKIWLPDRQDRTGQTDDGLIAYGEPFYKRSPKNWLSTMFVMCIPSESRINSYAILSSAECEIPVTRTTAQQFLRWATVPEQSGPKSGGRCAPFRGGAGSPSNTMSPGPRPTFIPEDILIHPTFWPQYTNVSDRQTGQRCHKG